MVHLRDARDSRPGAAPGSSAGREPRGGGEETPKADDPGPGEGTGSSSVGIVLESPQFTTVTCNPSVRAKGPIDPGSNTKPWK